MKHILKALIKTYQIVLSPWTGNQCRFHPTCSAYAHEAVDKHGAAKGSYLTIRRLLKCQPFYKGDFIDPVP
ncbi:MAG: membrane protein insertion efficiency factor YidD [Bdellovibrionales bacterium]